MKHTQNVKLEQQQNEVCMQKAVYTRFSLQSFFYSEIIQCPVFQAILVAHKRQVETEENLYQTAQAEHSAYERELRLVNKTFHELEERRFALQVCQ